MQPRGSCLGLPPSRPHAPTPHDGQASQWQRIKGSLLRDSRGQFKIVIKEDEGGFYFDTIAQTDVSDDRAKFRPRDYLVSIGRKAVDEFTLPMVRGVIKEAGSMLEVEVRRYAPNEARAGARAGAGGAGASGELPPWKPQWHPSPEAHAHVPAEPAAALAFAADFDDAFATRFDEGVTVTAACAAAPQAAAGGGGGGDTSEESFEQLRALCDQSQAAQQALLVCCVTYQAEIALLEEEARAAAGARRRDGAPNGHARGGEARGGGEEARGDEALQQAETLRKQNAALRAELRQQAAALKQAQRDTASLAQQLRAVTTS